MLEPTTPESNSKCDCMEVIDVTASETILGLKRKK
jgi:hypothetical protein